MQSMDVWDDEVYKDTRALNTVHACHLSRSQRNCGIERLYWVLVWMLR